MGTARNFSVKTGLDVDSGDLTIVSGNLLVNAGYIDIDNIKIDGQTISTVANNDAINITPNGTGSVVISKVDINAGTIDGATIATSDVTVGSSKTLDVSAGTLTTSAAQKKAIVEGVGADTDIGAFELRAQTFEADVATGTAPFTIASTTKVANLNVDKLDGSDWSAAPATAFGSDGAGVDVTFHSLTAGDNMLWDASEEQLVITGTNGATALNVADGNVTVADTLTATNIGAFTATGAIDFGSQNMTNVDIDSGTINGTTIAGASGSFTTLQASSSTTLVTLETSSTAKINGSALEGTTNLQVNGTPKVGGASGSTLTATEVRLFTDISNDDIAGSWNAYTGMSNVVILENAEDVKAGGQGVVHTVGTGADTGSTWAIGRMSGTSDIFTLGYFADNWDQIGYANASNNGQDSENPFLSANSRLSLNASGDMFLNANGASFNFTGATSGAAARKIGFKASSNGVTASGDEVYVLPVSFPSGNKILQSSSSGALSWVAAGSGESNQTLTTGNGISGANSGSTGDFTIAVEAAQTTITSLLATDIKIGEDDQTKIDFETADEIHFYAANAEQVYVADGIFGPQTDSDVDLGSTSVRWKDTFVDTLTVTGDVAVGDDLTLLSDDAILGFGTNTDVTLTHIHNTGLRLNAAMALQFRDSGLSISSTSNGQLDIDADAVVDIASQVVALTGTTGVAVVSPSVVFSDPASGKPVVEIKNTTNDTSSAELKFVKDKGAAGADADDVGKITFVGDDATQAQTNFAQILVEISEADDSDEAGKMSFLVAESNGTDTALTAGLVLEGQHATDGVVDVTIGAGTGSVTTIAGDLTVNGTTTTVNSTTIQLDDKNIELANGLGNDAAIDGGGITLISSGDNKTFNYVNANTAWTSSENFDIVSGKKYKLGGADIFTNATTLASGVVTSSLTQVGALNAGSITSGFTSIDVGSGAITTTGLISGGSLDIDDVLINGTTIGHTDDTDLITLANGVVTVAGEISVTTLDIGGTNVTSTAAELNLVDGITAGTVSASKAVIVDSDKDVTGFRNVTGTGALQGATLSVDAVAVLDTGRGDSQNISGATSLFNIPKATYRAAKIIYHIKKDGADDTDAGEILITYDGGDDTAYLTHYAEISTGSSTVGTWDATVNSGNIEVRFTPASNGAHTYSMHVTQLIT